MKIISIRGTHGSGKSWVAREVMKRHGDPVETIYQSGSKKVAGYLFGSQKPHLFVAGGYKEGVSTGGCDTMKDIRYVEQLVLDQANAGHNVLYEGIRVGGGHSKWIDLAWANKQHKFLYVMLNTSLTQCWENIRNRRALAGLPPADEKKVGVGVEDMYRRSRRQVDHFRHAGFQVDLLSSEEAVIRIINLLEQQSPMAEIAAN